MKSVKTLALILLIPFTALTVYAVAKVGYIGIFSYHLPSPAGWQVFADLVIGMILIMVWMVRDAKKNGRNVLPFVIATLFLGSFGPLLYLLLGPSHSKHG